MLFYDSRDTEILKATRNKLFASNEKQIDNQTLMTCFTHACTLCIPTTVEVSLKIFFGMNVVLC